MNNYPMKPVSEVPARRYKPGMYRQIVEEFLASGEEAVELDWQTIWPDKNVRQVAQAFANYFCQPARKAPEGVASHVRGRHIYLVRVY